MNVYVNKRPTIWKNPSYAIVTQSGSTYLVEGGSDSWNDPVTIKKLDVLPDSIACAFAALQVAYPQAQILRLREVPGGGFEASVEMLL